MTQLTKSTLISTPHNNIISYLDNRTYIPDPRDTSGNRVFVYESDPFSKGLGFNEFPYIICKFPRLRSSSMSVDNTRKVLEWAQEIIIRTVKDGASNSRADLGSNDLLTIEDSLFSFFNNKTYLQVMNDNNIFFPKLVKTLQDDFPVDQLYVYEARFELTFKERFTVA